MIWRVQINVSYCEIHFDFMNYSSACDFAKDAVIRQAPDDERKIEVIIKPMVIEDKNNKED